MENPKKKMIDSLKKKLNNTQSKELKESLKTKIAALEGNNTVLK